MQTQVLYYDTKNGSSNKLIALLKEKYPNALNPNGGLHFACVDNPFQEGGKTYIVTQDGTRMAIPNLQYIPALLCLRQKTIRYGDDIVRHIQSLYNQQPTFIGAPPRPTAGPGAPRNAQPTHSSSYPQQQPQQQPSYMHPPPVMYGNGQGQGQGQGPHMVSSQRGVQHPYQQQMMSGPGSGGQPVQPAAMGMGYGQPGQQGNGNSTPFLEAASDVWGAFSGGSLGFDFLNQNENTLFSTFEMITGMGGHGGGTGGGTGRMSDAEINAYHASMLKQRERDVPQHAYQTR